ncbi:MAG: hypothetical protein AAF596_03130, partial [Planctomycetota bacterium]
ARRPRPSPKAATHERRRGMQDVARALLLAAHLMAGAAACAAPAAATLLALSSRVREQWPAVIPRLVSLGICGVFVSALLGAVSGALLAIFGERNYLATLARVPAADLGFLVAEWLITVGLYGVMAWMARRGLRRPIVFAAIGVFAVTNLAYHFPTIMTMIGVEAASPSADAAAPLDRSAFRERMFTPLMAARTCHFWALTVTIGGVSLAVATQRERLSGSGRLAMTGAWTILAGLTLQALTGVATLALLPAASIRAMTGGDSIATLGVAAAASIALAAGYQVLPAAIGASNRLHTKRLAILLAAAVLLMTWSTSRSRQIIYPQSSKATAGAKAFNRTADADSGANRSGPPTRQSLTGSFFRSSSSPPGRRSALIMSPNTGPSLSLGSIGIFATFSNAPAILSLSFSRLPMSSRSCSPYALKFFLLRPWWHTRHFAWLLTRVVYSSLVSSERYVFVHCLRNSGTASAVGAPTARIPRATAGTATARNGREVRSIGRLTRLGKLA